MTKHKFVTVCQQACQVWWNLANTPLVVGQTLTHSAAIPSTSSALFHHACIRWRPWWECLFYYSGLVTKFGTILNVFLHLLLQTTLQIWLNELAKGHDGSSSCLGVRAWELITLCCLVLLLPWLQDTCCLLVDQLPSRLQTTLGTSFMAKQTELLQLFCLQPST